MVEAEALPKGTRRGITGLCSYREMLSLPPAPPPHTQTFHFATSTFWLELIFSCFNYYSWLLYHLCLKIWAPQRVVPFASSLSSIPKSKESRPSPGTQPSSTTGFQAVHLSSSTPSLLSGNNTSQPHFQHCFLYHLMSIKHQYAWHKAGLYKLNQTELSLT